MVDPEVAEVAATVPPATSWLGKPIPGRVGWTAYAVALAGALGALVLSPRHGGIPWLRVELAAWVITACLLLHVATRRRARRPVWARVGPLSVVTLMAVGGLAGVGFAQDDGVDESSPRPAMITTYSATVASDPVDLAISALSEPHGFPDADSFRSLPCVATAGTSATAIACWSTPLALPRATAAIVTMFDHFGFPGITTTCAERSHTCSASGILTGDQSIDAAVAVDGRGGCNVTFTWGSIAAAVPVRTAP
ncbi:MAG: hypothetical protein QOH99_45 [Frankiaceae bacterium]|nr:hypothetical protein [Frankiaceae bacterium]